MSVPNKQIGQSAEANLLWSIAKQLEYLTKVTSQISTGGGITDREFVVTVYTAKNNFEGASINDIITCTQVIDVTTDVPVTIATIWRNQSTATDLAIIPLFSNLSLEGTTALTDTELRASEVGVRVSNFPVTQPISGTVTANAGTNLNTSALALESGGNLASINTRDSDIVASGSVTISTPFTINLDAKGTYAFNASGTWVGNVIIEGSLDGITWVSTTFVALASGNASSTFSAPTSGQVNTVGLDYIRFRSNTISSGSVTITGLASRLVSNVMLDNSIPTGSNVIGSINNITGTVPLPTGASTSALQTTANTSLSTIATNTANPPVKLQDGSGTNITSTLINSKQRLDVTLGSGAAPGATAPGIGDMVGGTDGTNFQPLQMDASKNLKVILQGALPTGANNIGSITNVTQLLNGQTTHSSASTGSPIRIGGRVVPTTIATQDVTLVAGDASDAGVTPSQQLLIKQNAAAELDYNFIFSTGVTTITPQVLVQASGTASIRNYIKSLRISSDALGAAGSVWLLDGAYTVSSIAITTGLVTTSLAHDYKIGDAVVFTALAGGTGVSTNTVYYVTSIGSTTTFNFSATIGGSNVVPSVAYTGTTVYRILDQIRFQTTALEPTLLDYSEPLRSSANMAINFLIPLSLLTGNIYITINGYRGF